MRLGKVASLLAIELRKQPGIVVTVPVHRRSTVEDCYRIEVHAALDESYDASASYSLIYVFARGATIYSLIVRGQAGLLVSFRPLAEQIAARFRFRQ